MTEIDPLAIVVLAFVGGFALVSFLWRFVPSAKNEAVEREAEGREDFEELSGEFESWSADQAGAGTKRTEGEYADILGLDGRITPSVLEERYREAAAEHVPGSEGRRLVDEARGYFLKRFGR